MFQTKSKFFSAFFKNEYSQFHKYIPCIVLPLGRFTKKQYLHNLQDF